jgi:hydrogenase-4 component B
MEQSMILAVLVFWPMLGALIALLIGCKSKTIRDYAVWVVTGVELLLICGQSIGFYQYRVEEYLTLSGVCGLGLSFALDGFRCVYGIVAGFMWFMTVFTGLF